MSVWNDDETAFGQCPFFLNPEAAIFDNPIAQASCAADSISATAGFPIDALFWCAGCQGSMYLRTLSVFGACRRSYRGSAGELLLTSRMLAKLHREGLAKGISGKSALCKPYLAPIIPKTQYKQ